MPTFPNELIYRIIDSLSDDVVALGKCSLVSKQWLPYARHYCFNDIAIRLCERHNLDHRTPRLHQRCIIRFALLVKSKHATIPRSVRTLELNGKGFNTMWMNPMKLVANGMGMEDTWALTALMKYFHSVEHLVLVKLHWFTQTSRSSRTIAHFLSSVKSLTLDDVSFNGGPRAILWMLENTTKLGTLTVGKITWPARYGMPNDASNFHILMINLSLYLPVIFTPLRKLAEAIHKIGDKMGRSEASYSLSETLHKLHINCSYRHSNSAEHVFLLSRPEILRTITTIGIKTVCTSQMGIDEVALVQSFLDAIHSLNHLRIHFSAGKEDGLTSPTLQNLQMLQSLSIYIDAVFEVPKYWIPWLQGFLQTVKTNSQLSTVQLNMRAYAHGPEYDLVFQSVDDISPRAVSSENPNFDEIDRYIAGLSNIQQVTVRFEMLRLSYIKEYEELREVDARKMENRLRRAFRRCDATCRLSVEVVNVLHVRPEC